MEADPRAHQTRELDLETLVAAARSLVARSATSPPDGRVSEHADARTVRYYQTLGVVSRPLRYDGRNAVYGYRHLLELVAIKLLQAQGLSLAQVQKALLRATTPQLEKELSSALSAGTGGSGPTSHADAGSLREPAAYTAGRVAAVPVTDGTAGPSAQPAGAKRSRRLLAVQIAPGLTVTIDPAVVPDPEQLLTRIAEGLAREDGETS